MKTRLGVFGMTFCFAAALAVSTHAQEKKPDPKEIEKKFKEYGTPGKPHENFKRLVGRWNAAIVAYEGGKPEKAKGSATFRVILGGRFLQQNFRGKMAGQSFQGIGFSGYDKAQKKYVGTWMDSMSTGILHTEGAYDAKTHTMTETGKMASPIGPMSFKMVTKYIDNDKFLFTMHLVTPQGEQKMMEITYTRDKSAKKGKGKKGKKGKKKD